MTKRSPRDRRALLAFLLLSSGACSAAGSPTRDALHFDQDVRLLFRIAACAGAESIPSRLEAVVDAHCRALQPYVDDYRETYVERAQSFLVRLQPQGLPTVVVYPFGGGDLVSALTTYPNLTEVTTLSLEHAGDPRRIADIDAPHLEDSLLRVRKAAIRLLTQSDSLSEDLMQLERGNLPGELALFLIGLAVHNQEPVGLVYFSIGPDGEPRYLEADDVARTEGQIGQALNSEWTSPDFSVAFSNMELTFRPRSAPGSAPRVHRHIAANLMDSRLTADPSIIRYLEKRGRVAAMTKAASYTLWNDRYSMIRTVLLDRMEFMISDSTGIPQSYAARGGFVQETYGWFEKPFLETSETHSKDFARLWASQPKRTLPFRYGYLDDGENAHLLVTRRSETKP